MFLYFWSEHRKTDFYDIIQPSLLKLSPPLENLEGDFRVLYAVNLRDAYEEWLSCMEYLEIIVPWNSLLKYQVEPEDFRKEMSARYSTHAKKSHAGCEAMINR
jgi:hypothetical protein